MEEMVSSRWTQGVIACAVLSGLLMAPAPGSAQIPGTFTKFDVPGAGTEAGEGTSPHGINDRGEITGEFKDASSVVHGFIRHQDGTFSSFDAPRASTAAGLGTLPRQINNSGEVAGFYNAGPKGVRHGFVRHPDGSFTVIDPPGSIGTVVQSLNERGQVTGNYVAGGAAHGFIWNKDGTYTSFDPEESINTAPMNINASGDIVGYFEDVTGTLHGFLRYADGKFSMFNTPGANATNGLGTYPMAISDDGEIVGYYNAGPNKAIHGFVRHADGTFTRFDPPGSITDQAIHTDEDGYVVRPATAPVSINAGGEIAGYFGDAKGVLHGFVRHTNGAFATFEAPGASRSGDLGTFPMSINRTGEITGYYQSDPDTVLHGFVVKPPRGGNSSGAQRQKKFP
jgi:probable HAF family extracellular repeat protein